MKYQVKIEKRPLKFIKSQPPRQQARIFEAIAKLPDIGDIKPLKGTDNVYRLRVGTYRILYTVDNGILVVCIIDAGNRGDVYK